MVSNLPAANPTDSFWLSEISNILKGYRTQFTNSTKSCVTMLILLCVPGSTAEIPAHVDVAIIGSGISGTFAARTLLVDLASQALDLDVVMFEAREVCSGASGRVSQMQKCFGARVVSLITGGKGADLCNISQQNGGHCQPALYSGDAEITRLEMATYNLISQLVQEHGIDCDWQPRGAVTAFYSKGDFDRAVENLEKSQAALPEISDHLQLVTPDSNQPSLHDLGVSKAKGAIINKLAASLWPYKLIARIVEDLIDQYPRFNLHTNTPVQFLERSAGGYKLQTPRGTCIARHVLLATNGYTSHLLPGMSDIIQPVRGNMVGGRGGIELLLDHSYGLIDELSAEEYKGLARASERLIGDGEYLMQRPLPNRGCGDRDGRERTSSPLILIGGARFMVSDSGYGLSDDSILDDAANKFLRGRLAQVLDAVAKAPEEFHVTHEWTGIMGYSADGFPWVGELQSGLWLCAGYSGHGMPQAALCAVSVAKMILRQIQGNGERVVRGYQEPELPARFLITPQRMNTNGL